MYKEKNYKQEKKIKEVPLTIEQLIQLGNENNKVKLAKPFAQGETDRKDKKC